MAFLFISVHYHRLEKITKIHHWKKAALAELNTSPQLFSS